MVYKLYTVPWCGASSHAVKELHPKLRQIKGSVTCFANLSVPYCILFVCKWENSAAHKWLFLGALLCPRKMLIFDRRGNSGTTIQEKKALIALFKEKFPTPTLKYHQKKPLH